MRLKWVAGTLVGVVVACSSPSDRETPTGGTDGGAKEDDAGSILTDGGEQPDAGDHPDAGDPTDGGDEQPDAGTTPDAGEEADAGPGDGGSSTFDPCTAAGLSVCDDFESATAGGPPSSATWKIESFQNEGSLSIDNTVAHSGSKSVHVLGQWNGSFRYIMFSTTKPFPATNNSYYTRVFLRSKNAMGEGHSTYFGGYQTDWQRTLRIGFIRNMLEANLTHPSSEWELQSGDWNTPSNGIQFVPGQWHCIETFFDGANNEIRVWFEGQEVQRLHTTNWNASLSNWMPNFQVARFGFETYHGEQAELWYDDVAIGSQRIGCGE